MQVKIYISGPISNDPYHRESFGKAEEYLKHLGYDIVNPLNIQEKEFSGPDKEIKLWNYFMRKSIRLLMGCDQIYMLENWEESRGARIEHQLATDLSMPRMYEEEDIEYV